MNKKTSLDVKLQYGEQLLKYREVTGLTQREYAEYLKLGQNEIVNAETGKHSLGIDNLEKYAQSFGVPYYVMGNPAIPPPTFDELPKKLKDYIAKVNLEKEKKKAEPQQDIKKVVDEEIPTFLATPKTALAFVEHLKKFGLTATAQNIKTLLISKKRQKLVRVIPAEEWGGEVDQYVLTT